MSSTSYDNEIGTLNKPPRLMDTVDYPNWKKRMEAFINLIDYTLWDCYNVKEPVPIVESADTSRRVAKTPDLLTDSERTIVSRYKKAYSYLTMALPNDVLQNFKEFTTSDSLWNALLSRYEGNSEMKEFRKEELIKQYLSFTCSDNDSFTSQANRYIRLVSDLKSMGKFFEAGEVNKRFLHSLSSKWRMYVLMVRKNEPLNSMTIEELVSILETYNLELSIDDQKFSGYNSSANHALISPINATPVSTYGNSQSSNYQPQYYQQTPTANVQTHYSQPPVQTTVQNIVGSDENKAVYSAFVGSFEALTTGNLQSPALMNEDLSQIDDDDLEEMDLKWQMAMVAARAKRFFRKTGRNQFRTSSTGNVGFDKSKARCFNCQQLGHFRRECTVPVTAHGKAPSTSIKITTPNSPESTTALVSQHNTTGEGYDWSFQAEDHQALMANIDEFSESVPLEVRQSICSTACIITLNQYRDHNHCLIKDMELVRNINTQLKNEELVYKTKLDSLKKDLISLDDQNKNLRAQLGDMVEQCKIMKEATFEVESRVDNYNFNTKLTNKLLDSLVIQKGKSGLGFTRVEPPLNHNYSCNPVSCDNDFIASTSLTVNPPSFTVNDSTSTACNENVSVSTTDVNVNVNDSINLDNVCETETVDISHEIPVSIIRNENITSTNHIKRFNTQHQNVKASKFTRGKMVNLQSQTKSIERKPLYNNKQEAKRDFNKFVSAGTSVHKSAKLNNDNSFSFKKLIEQVKSKFVSKSFDASKTGQTSRLCTEKKAQESGKKHLNPNLKSKQTVPTKKGTDCKQYARCIQGNDRNNRQRSIAPHKNGGINQKNARPQQNVGHFRSTSVKSSNKCVNTNIKLNSTKVQICECVCSKRSSTVSAKSNKNVFQLNGRSHNPRKVKSYVAVKQISAVPSKGVTSGKVKQIWVKKVLPSENHKLSKDSHVQKVQKHNISVKIKPFYKQIWKRKEPTLIAVNDPQPKLVHVEVTYKDAQGMPRTCMSWVPDFN